MKTGTIPVQVVKLFVCGAPAAGKTTLKNSLTKVSFSLWFIVVLDLKLIQFLILRLRSFFVKTDWVCHVWCNFQPGYTCHTTACVNKSASTFTFFFLRNKHKSLVRINIDMTDINNSFLFFFLCNLDLWFKSYSKFCEVRLNLFGLVTKEPVWPVDQLLTISYSFLLERCPFCKAFVCCMI